MEPCVPISVLRRHLYEAPQCVIALLPNLAVFASNSCNTARANGLEPKPRQQKLNALANSSACAARRSLQAFADLAQQAEKASEAEEQVWK
jgi:hypothetical protein